MQEDYSADCKSTRVGGMVISVCAGEVVGGDAGRSHVITLQTPLASWPAYDLSRSCPPNPVSLHAADFYVNVRALQSLVISGVGLGLHKLFWEGSY